MNISKGVSGIRKKVSEMGCERRDARNELDGELGGFEESCRSAQV
ncbi:MAG: hypothetical protein ACO1NS_09205 [Daejeonella sp.]